MEDCHNKKAQLRQRGTCNSGACLKAWCEQNLSQLPESTRRPAANYP